MPELMLSDKLQSCTWKPMEKQSDTSTRGGETQVIELGEPYWRLSFRYEEMTDASFHALEGWIARRRGALNSFLAYKPSKPTLKLDDSATNAGVSAGSYDPYDGSVQFQGLTKARLSLDDMVSYQITGGYFVGMVTEIVSETSSSSRVITFPPASDAATAFNAKILKPTGEFRLIPSTLNLNDRYDGRHSVSFDARQVEP